MFSLKLLLRNNKQMLTQYYKARVSSTTLANSILFSLVVSFKLFRCKNRSGLISRRFMYFSHLSTYIACRGVIGGWLCPINSQSRRKLHAAHDWHLWHRSPKGKQFQSSQSEWRGNINHYSKPVASYWIIIQNQNSLQYFDNAFIIVVSFIMLT